MISYSVSVPSCTGGGCSRLATGTEYARDVEELHIKGRRECASAPWWMWRSSARIVAMCGIAGLFAKTPDVEEVLGRALARMLLALADRGPDSAGVALYRNAVARGRTKLSLVTLEG